MQSMLTHLYTNCMSERDRKHEALVARHEIDARKHVKMDRDELSQSVSRLYDARMKEAADQREKLRKKHLATLPPVLRDSARVEHGIQSLYYAEKQRAKDRESKLEKMYVASTGPKVPRMSPAECAAIVARLTSPSPA